MTSEIINTLFPEKLDNSEHPDIQDETYIGDEIFRERNLLVINTEAILFGDMGFLNIFFLNQMVPTECQTTFCLCIG